MISKLFYLNRLTLFLIRMLTCGHSFCKSCLLLMLPNTCSQQATMISKLIIQKSDYKKQAKIFDSDGDIPSIELLCPECQVVMKVQRTNS